MGGVLILAVLLCLIIFIVYKLLTAPTSKSVEEQIDSLCMNYEFQNEIPKGSCDCAHHLFSDFSKSYDWIDSCQILHSIKN